MSKKRGQVRNTNPFLYFFSSGDQPQGQANSLQFSYTLQSLEILLLFKIMLFLFMVVFCTKSVMFLNNFLFSDLQQLLSMILRRRKLFRKRSSFGEQGIGTSLPTSLGVLEHRIWVPSQPLCPYHIGQYQHRVRSLQ